MFDIGFWELAVIGVIALVILGPERLPKLARTAGMWIGRARRMVATVKEDINAELESERLKEVAKSFKETQQELQTTASGLEKNMLGDEPVTGLTDSESVKDLGTVPGGNGSINRGPRKNKKSPEETKTPPKNVKTGAKQTTTATKKTKVSAKKKQATT